jgi:NADH dehydrogenase (ubiquinone) 1 alpha subcomplex subunit 5
MTPLVRLLRRVPRRATYATKVVLLTWYSSTKAHGSKTTTGLVGVPVEAHPLPALEGIYSELLQSLATLPKDSVYRSATEALTKARLSAVRSASPEAIPALESEIGAGQVEELLLQAKGELQLVKTLHDCKPWEDLEEAPPAGLWKTPGAL